MITSGPGRRRVAMMGTRLPAAVGRGCPRGSRLNVGLPHATHTGLPPGFGALALGEEKYWWGPHATLRTRLDTRGPRASLQPAARSPHVCSLQARRACTRAAPPVLPPALPAALSLVSTSRRCHADGVAASLPVVH